MSNNLLLASGAGEPLPPFESRLPWVGGDLQTLKNTLSFDPPDFRPYPARRLQLPLRDGSGDTLLALLNLPQNDKGKPIVVLVHGLTGSELSRNIQESAAYHLTRGFPVMRLNLRNAGPSLGTCRHFYHAGRSQDLRDAISALPADLLARKLFLAGMSLGGNLLLKCLAERTGLEPVIGAASVCAPIDLKAAQMEIMKLRNTVYQKHLLKCLIRDSLIVMKDPEDVERLRSVRTIFEYDDRIVAPMGGFSGADDYYRRSSAASLLPAIEIPTLVIAASNDPWIPAQTYLDRDWSGPSALSVAITRGGGHVGFHGKDGPVPWHNRAIGAFLETLI